MKIRLSKLDGWTPASLARLAVLPLILAAMAPAQQVVINEYSIPSANSNANIITLGPDGALWFTERNSSKVGRITTAGVITEYPVVANSQPYAITTGPDGALWFVEQTGPAIGRITTSGAVNDYPVPGANFGAAGGIVTGPDGALWFTEQGSNQIGRITTTGAVTEYVVPTASSVPTGITTGPDGALWFGEASGNKIGRITTAGAITEYPIPTAGASPGAGIVTGPDGALWFAEQNSDKIGRITTTGVFTEYAVPTANSAPNWIAVGDDGALWFTEQNGNNIARITTAGIVTEYPIPTASCEAVGIATGPDGAEWFVENMGDKIGQVITVTALMFANQVAGTSSPSQAVTFTNIGDSPMTISSITVAGADALDFSQTNNCGTGLAAGASCTISVVFTPAQTGPLTATVTITDNGAGYPESITMSGTGVASGPNVTLSPTNLTFPTELVGVVSPPEPVTLTNYGSSALRMTSIKITGTDRNEFGETSTCHNALAAGASCTINVIFSPSQRGPRTADVSITDNAPGSPQSVSLKGTGTVVKLNPSSLNFGSLPGGSKTLTTTLTNVGTGALGVSGISITGTGFSQTNNCGSSVGAGASCTISVTFTPTHPGGFSGAVSISDNGGGSPQTVPLSGTGIR